MTRANGSASVVRLLWEMVINPVHIQLLSRISLSWVSIKGLIGNIDVVVFCWQRAGWVIRSNVRGKVAGSGSSERLRISLHGRRSGQDDHFALLPFRDNRYFPRNSLKSTYL